MSMPLSDPPKPPTNGWDVLLVFMHYLAAAVLLAGIAAASLKFPDKVDPNLFVNLCVGGLVGLGIYQGTKPKT